MYTLVCQQTYILHVCHLSQGSGGERGGLLAPWPHSHNIIVLAIHKQHYCFGLSQILLHMYMYIIM